MAAYGCFADVYDVLTSNIDYDALAGYYDGIIMSNAKKRGILLDLACGTGSMSRRFSRLGYDVIGVDLSGDMLSFAKEKPHDGIEYLCQDMTSLDLFGTVDVTVCALDSINHLENEQDILSCFKSVSLFTDPDGLFLFDMNTVRKHREVLADNTFVYDTDGAYCVWQNFYEKELDRVDILLDIFTQNKDGTFSRSCEEFSEIALPCDTVCKLLSQAGFDIIDIFDYPTLNKGDDNSEKLLFCCKKQKKRDI